jgi:hypothetical protein
MDRPDQERPFNTERLKTQLRRHDRVVSAPEHTTLRFDWRPLRANNRQLVNSGVPVSDNFLAEEKQKVREGLPP